MDLRKIAFAALGGLAAVYVAFSAVLLFGRPPLDSAYVPGRQIRLKEVPRPIGTPPAEDAQEGASFRVAVAPVISPEKSLHLYKPLVQYLGEALGRKGSLVQRSSYAEVNDLIRHGQCEIAFICTYALVQGENDFGLKVLAVPQVRGRLSYRSFLIVTAESPAASLLDLRGKRFGSSDILSNSGWLYPATWLLKRGENPDRFFGRHVITGSHDRSIQAVASGFVDGAAVDSLVYEQMTEEDPSLLSRVRKIAESPDFGMPPVVSSPAMDPHLRAKVLETLLHMHETPQGQEALSKVGIERFVRAADDLYDSVREAVKLWESRR